ncbi:hypothetical protein G7A66_09350 [Altererythrobacter sp. SALINAS58]|uniref:DUF6481 family protein n=1 Tax=Alteripontixanthobacter muriae TaxID=2705546 RepID=UPI0015765C2A|nr:hypothetical protein [Alteripontixanthobacter muriae]
MKGYKAPGFQDRVAASARTKNAALEELKARPKPDKATLAEAATRQKEREAKAAAKRETTKAVKAEKRRVDEERLLKAEQEKAKAEPPVRTEAEKKAARDAKYAARKSRKS